jgi:succinoglycan biosynthesis protein ExoA
MSDLPSAGSSGRSPYRHAATRGGPQPANSTLTGPDWPVSVVMPVRNEERYLRESVRHVLGQAYPGEIEIILAVGPSHDRTAELAGELAAADPRVRLVDNPSGQRPSGVNLGLQAARHDVIVRVDGHCMLPPGYIGDAVATLVEKGAANVGGIMAAEGVTPFEKAVAWAMTSPFGVGAARFHTGGEAGPADTVYLGVFRREAIEQVGGYDERYQIAEDWELNHRIRQAGGLIWFKPELRVSYRPRATLAALGRQYFSYGRWRRVVARQHTGTVNLRYLAPPMTLAAVAAGTVVGLAGVAGLAAGAAGSWPGALTAAFALPALYAAGIGAVTARAARDLPFSARIRLPLVLSTMHMCWGAGYLTSPRRLVPSP